VTACFRRPFPGCWHTPRSGSGGDGAVAPAAEGHTQRPEGWKKDETDRELDTILQQIYSDQCGSDSIEERTGPPSAFFAAAVKVLPRAKDDRTRAKRWRDAHDKQVPGEGEPLERLPRAGVRVLRPGTIACRCTLTYKRLR